MPESQRLRSTSRQRGEQNGRVASEAILGRDVHVEPQAAGALAPRVVFTEPQVAAVGHTLASALEASGTRAGDYAASTQLPEHRVWFPATG